MTVLRYPYLEDPTLQLVNLNSSNEPTSAERPFSKTLNDKADDYSVFGVFAKQISLIKFCPCLKKRPRRSISSATNIGGRRHIRDKSKSASHSTAETRAEEVWNSASEDQHYSGDGYPQGQQYYQQQDANQGEYEEQFGTVSSAPQSSRNGVHAARLKHTVAFHGVKETTSQDFGGDQQIEFCSGYNTKGAFFVMLLAV